MSFPEEPEDKSQTEKAANEETKIEDEATIRLLLCTSKEESEWQYNVAKKYRQFEKHGAKVKVEDSKVITLEKTTEISYGEIIFELTGNFILFITRIL